jgi:ParB/RepB/Spo0J family partition protein
MQSTAPTRSNAPPTPPAAVLATEIPVDRIRPNPDQPRRHFAGIEDLARSLKERGQVTPILVRPVEGGGYELVHGERRWRAAQLAGLKTLRAEVRPLDEEEAFRLALVENVQRADLNAIEEGNAFRQLLAEGMTQAQVGALVGKTQSYVAQKIRLLNAPACLRALLAGGALAEGHARELLRLERLHAPGLVCRGLARPDDPQNGELLGMDEAAYLASTQPWEDPDALLVIGACRWLRPEDEPPSVLWLYPWEDLRAYAHLPALRRSWVALLRQSEATADAVAAAAGGYPAGRDGALYRAEHSVVPQWIAAAWWWGAAAALGEWSVVDLSRHLDGWSRRHRSALVFARLFPRRSADRTPVPPAHDADFWREHRDWLPARARRAWLPDVTDTEAWRWGHEWDLQHSNAGDLLTRKDDAAVAFVKECVEENKRIERIWFPSAFQRWGSEHEAARRLHRRAGYDDPEAPESGPCLGEVMSRDIPQDAAAGAG